jgi:N-formylglutamate amidohydrolase
MLSLKKCVKFRKGTIPLILSVPHGGILECEEIPIRQNGVLGIDKGTIELGERLVKYMKKTSNSSRFKKRVPTIIISKVHRNRIDLNREEREAYVVGSSLAKAIYSHYHNIIKETIIDNIKIFNNSLLIDIHGFETKDRPKGFRDVDLILGTNNLTSFFSNPVPKKFWRNTIRGKIIKRFLKLGVLIAPGHPRRREYVLKGGYIVQNYGYSNITKSRTIQIEFSERIRLLNTKLRKLVLKNLAEMLMDEFN